MASSFTPILKTSTDRALSSYVIIEDVFILLDCGWDGESDLSVYAPIIPLIKFVLISNPTLDNIGGLPFVASHPDFKGKIYITEPVLKMSHLCIYDHYFSTTHKEFTVDHIEATYKLCISLKHSQKVHIKEKGLVFTPYRSGNNVGGSYWRITHNMQDIIYMPLFNPHPLKHIEGLDFSPIQTPAVLVFDGFSSEDEEKSPKDICEKIKDTLTNGGSVLIPVEATGSVLEILFVLQKFWEDNHSEVESYPLYFLSHFSDYTRDYAKTCSEWSEALCNSDSGRDNQTFLNYVRVIQDISQIQVAPACILATPGNLEYGFSRELFFKMCSNPLNQVIFLSKTAGLVQKVLETRPSFLETNDEVLIWSQDETSTEVSESPVMHEELKQHESSAFDQKIKSYGPKLFEDKTFKFFAVCEWKHFCDEYGESLVEEEMELWKRETFENDLKKEAIEQSQKLNSKLFEMEKCRKLAILEKITRKSFVNAQISYCFCEFKANAISIKLSLAKIRPKKIVFIEPLPERLGNLKIYCESVLGISEVLEVNERIQLIASMSIHPIKISEEFYNSMKFVPLDGYDVAYISGQVSVEHEQLHFEPKETKVKQFGYFLGTVKLGRIRNLLNEKGFKAEFREGKLVINDKVIFYKKGNSAGIQDYVIEGVASKDYFEIRKIIYAEHQYV
jgi:Cft2 family RNA processing exonuclease